MFVKKTIRLWRVALLLLPFCIGSGATPAAEIKDIKLEQVQKVFADATAMGAVDKDGKARAVFAQSQPLGYVFLTDEIMPIPAFSGVPISTLVGLDLSARITGLAVIEHEEPILVVGITEAHLRGYIDQYISKSAFDKVRVNAHNRKGYVGIDGITGATITAMVLNRSVMRSVRIVTDFYGLPKLSGTESTGESPKVSRSLATDIEPQPIWGYLWENKAQEMVLLSIALAGLIGVLFFQDWLVLRPVLFGRVRLGYQLFTVFYVGFYCMAQLSIVNVLAFVQLLVNGFTWETLLIDPIIFALWGFVAFSVLLWGRGVYCGWLCPFGQMQDLLFKGGEKLGLKQFEVPQLVHERLWAIKYFFLIFLIGISLESLGSAARFAEVEPFKTAFNMNFNREWYYVVWVFLILLISVFNGKFFCKYLCVLGASLSLFTRFKVFDWLRRRKECGRPCQICASQCHVGAVKPTGEIIDTECHYCLECQVIYWDDKSCPPLVAKRLTMEKRRRTVETIDVRQVD